MSKVLLAKQRSHALLVLSNSVVDRMTDFELWYRGVYQEAVRAIPGVIGAQQYEQHTVDITLGAYPPPPFRYIQICELSVDGAETAVAAIERIRELHRRQPAAQAPATWLYYPMSERVGRPSGDAPSMITVAFANAIPGREQEFREWYATRHIRHALNIPVLVSGQCFERTQFQSPGALASPFSTIAIYEQDGTPEAFVESVASLSEKMFEFPSMDPKRFAEWAYFSLAVEAT